MLVGHMEGGNILPVLAGIGIMLALAVRYWLRRRRAARQADQLLEDVVKAKDAFRR
jgi:LPXTG-motif cell wall-anchored protein